MLQSLNGTSILVVDDDPETLSLYVTRFGQLGATVHGAHDARSALMILATFRPDVVLCDLHLPEMDGYGLISKIHEQPDLAHVPVIAISGSHPDLEIGRCRREGFVEHLTKPVRLATVVESIRHALAS